MPATRATPTSTAGRASTRSRRAPNQRADAQRNREKILRAAVSALRKNPEASVADIATEAGIGRVTVYGHFPTRAELIEAALVDSLDRGEQVLQNVDLGGDAAQAFQRLIDSSWSLVDQARALLAAAQKELPAARIRELHEEAEARMRALIERGQREGAFRTDLPVTWLLATTHVVMNGASEEVRADRLDSSRAPQYISAVLLPAISATPQA